MRAKVGTGAAYVDVFATQLIENLDTNFAAGDVLFFGAYAGLGPLLKEGLDLDVYALELLTAEDRPRARVVRGRAAAVIKEAICRMTVVALRAEARGVPVYRWLQPGPAPALPAAAAPVALAANNIDSLGRYGLMLVPAWAVGYAETFRRRDVWAAICGLSTLGFVWYTTLVWLGQVVP